ncbi:MAG TPA: ribosome silencing factor [Methylibium sp.]|nr:ribosome silencing factor [Methylibium sp.]
MDIRKLQRAIVDGLEDVKAQDIQVFNTEHMTPLFERVIVASGTSNRQTKALASSVRDAVKAKGFDVLRTEGEANGEWIIVDCGAAVAHIMQPEIRRYYHLEEIWGEKPVALKRAAPRGLVKAEEPIAAAKAAPAKKAAPKRAAPKAAVAEAVPAAAKKRSPAAKKAPVAAKKAVVAAKPAPAKKAAAPRKAASAKGASAARPAAKRASAAKPAAAGRSAATKAPKRA